MNKELVSMFNRSFYRWLEKNPTQYNAIDLSLISENYIEQYLFILINHLDSLISKETEKRSFDNVLIFYPDITRLDMIKDFTSKMSDYLLKKDSPLIISEQHIENNAVTLAEKLNLIKTETTVIIIDPEKITKNKKDHVNITESRTPELEVDQLGAIIKQLHDNSISDSIYISCCSGFNPNSDIKKFTAFFDEMPYVGLYSYYNEGESHKRIEQALSLAKSHLQENDITSSYKSIYECDDIDDKNFVFLQILDEFNYKNNGLYTPHIVQMIKETDLETDLSLQSATNLARICIRSQCYTPASKLLWKIDSYNKTPEQLEGLIYLVKQTNNQDLQDKWLSELEDVYPDSELLLENKIIAALKEENYDEAANSFELLDYSHKDKSTFLRSFSEWISNEQLDIHKLLLQGKENNELQTFIISVVKKWFLKRLRYTECIAIIYDEEHSLSDEELVSSSQQIFESWFLNKKDNEDKDSETLQQILMKLLDETLGRVFNVGVDPRLRELFKDTFDYSRSGLIGRAMLAYLTYSNFTKKKIIINDSIKPPYTKINNENFDEKLKSSLCYISQINGACLGITLIPQEILGSNREELWAFLERLQSVMIAAASDYEDEKDLDMFKSMLFIANSAAIYAAPCAIDLDIIKNIGSILSTIGKFQAGRDMAEMALQLAGVDALRQTHAGIAAAEIYHRQNHLHAAMFYLNAVKIENAITSNLFFSWSNLLIRILRDCGITEIALRAVQSSREVLIALEGDVYANNKHVYDFLDLSVKFKDFLLSDSQKEIELQSLIDSAKNIAALELSHTNNLAPILTLSLQIRDIVNLQGWTLDEDFKDIIEELILAGTPGHTPSGLISAFKDLYEIRNVDGLMKFYNLVTGTRYAGDRAYDDHNLHFYAAIFLRKVPASSVKDTVFAGEMLMDHAYSSNSSLQHGVAFDRYNNIDEPHDFAKNYAQRNKITIYMLILDDQKNPSLVCWEPGYDGRMIEQSLWKFNYSAFMEWKLTFPYQYGFEDSQSEKFFNTEAFFNIFFDIIGPCVWLVDILLHSWVPNLTITPSGFAGLKAPISCAPSLAWLNQVNLSPIKTNGKCLSWISTADEKHNTLKTLAEEFNREGGVFQKFNVTHSGYSHLPVGFENAELVIVAAHGGVTNPEQQFHSISDEGNLRVHYNELARKLRNCGVVILFVCSAGRHDNHPDAATTNGLVKSLLDEGCCTVIASPWPLNAMMTFKWLPPFMEKWMNGETINDSVFHANSETAEYYSFQYGNCLALNIYGDGSRCFNT